MRTPIIIVNCKAYREGTGPNAVKLAKLCERTARGLKLEIAIAVQAADVNAVANSVKIPVFAQHADPVVFGQYTGHVLPESLAANGAKGTLLNHSERRIPIETIADTVARCKDAGLRLVVCAKDATEAGRLATLRPDFVAYEPPELIGGNLSVSTAKPDVVRKAVEKIGKNSICIVGAGVKNAADVRKSVELGARGVLVASGVVLAKDQEKALRELASGFER